MLAVISRALLLSSTTSTRMCWSTSRDMRREALPCALRPRRAVKWNSEPTPGSL
jgi:hypothetical protein